MLANCLFLDTHAQADRFRYQLLNHCLRVSRSLSTEPDGEHFVRIAIVGAGATGVELAAELYNAASALGYYGLEVFDESRIRVTLIEAGPRICPRLPERLAEAARRGTRGIGRACAYRRAGHSVTPGAIQTQAGETIAADLKVWAAGVRGPEWLRSLGGLECTAGAQLVVRSTLQVSRDERSSPWGIAAVARCQAQPVRYRPAPRPRIRWQTRSATTLAD